MCGRDVPVGNIDLVADAREFPFALDGYCFEGDEAATRFPNLDKRDNSPTPAQPAYGPV